jgi:hypothetical protein
VLLVLPQNAPAETSALKPGLAWIFYNTSDMTRPHSTGVDAQIDQDTGTEIDGCGKTWLGRIRAPIAGEVTVVVEADDGARVWVGGKQIIDAWTPQQVSEGLASFESEGQWLPLRVDYYQQGGVGFIRLYWTWPGRLLELIPGDRLAHTDRDARSAEEKLTVKSSAEEVPLANAKARLYAPAAPVDRGEPLRLKPGPHLFIDDYLIASSENVRRVVNRPERDPAIPNPIVTGKEDGCFQPYLTVVRDPETQVFRMWYGHRTQDSNPGRSRLGYLESKDGVHWVRPRRLLGGMGPIQFGVSVIDEGPEFANAGQRFKYGWWYGGGLRVATSPDGIVWSPLSSEVVLHHNHDINSIFRDPLRERYVATASVYRPGDTWEGSRRITMHSFSDDLVSWSTPHYVVLPDPSVDEGETQFYAMEGYLARGDLVVGMVKVLRDDLKADDPPDPPEAYGLGYTALAWTRDGETWTRDPEPFFDRHPEQGVWDHAHAWIDEQVSVGHEVFLYYGGYARGHKVGRFEERQIGLVKMQRDRYVARAADAHVGHITTPVCVLDGTLLTVNADASRGHIRVQLLTEDGQPMPGFTFEDCPPITADATESPVKWPGSLSHVKGKKVRLSFELVDARIFALNLE